MNCHQTTDQLSTWLDGELPADAAIAIEDHLASCSACATKADELRSLNSQLSNLFAADRLRSQRVTDCVSNQLLLQSPSASTTTKSRANSPLSLGWRVRWVASLVAATAAGFLVAMIVLPQTPELPQATEIVQRTSNEPPSTRSPFATVEVATGPVEVAPITTSVFTRPQIPVVEVGMKMRTGPKKCELRTADGTTIRLDRDTVISVPRDNELVLEQGRLWCRRSAEGPMTVKSDGTAAKVDNAVVGLSRCDDGTELIALEGDVEVVGGKWSSVVCAGKKVRYNTDSVLAESGIDNPVLATRWLNELLLLNDDNDAELQARVEQLWAAVGFAKLQNLYEDELRSLGVGCVSPLTSFLKSDDADHQQSQRRILATKILADVAGFRSIPVFVELLEDENGDVRLHAARGLQRLTGRDLGVDAKRWRDASAAERAKWRADWQNWIRTQNDWFPRLKSEDLIKPRVLPTKA